MPEFKADLLPRLLIKAAVNTIAVATIDRCGMAVSCSYVSNGMDAPAHNRIVVPE